MTTARSSSRRTVPRWSPTSRITGLAKNQVNDPGDDVIKPVTVVAFELLTEQPRVRIFALLKY